jgi:putative flippase GtrA
MAAKTRALSATPTASPGLGAGSTVAQEGWRWPTAPLTRELVRYAVAGGLASLVDVGVLVVLTSSLGVYYLHAAALAFSAGLLTSYGLSIAWVFQARIWQHPWMEFGLFTLIGGIGLLGCGVCMWVLTEYAHLHYLYAKLGSALVVFGWNFVAKKWLLFHQAPRRLPGVPGRATHVPSCPVDRQTHGAPSARGMTRAWSKYPMSS